MGSEGVCGKAGIPLVPLAAGWPDGLHAAPPRQLVQGYYCCFGDQEEDCCYCCLQAGWHRCPPAPRGGTSGGLCGGKDVLG